MKKYLLCIKKRDFDRQAHTPNTQSVKCSLSITVLNLLVQICRLPAMHSPQGFHMKRSRLHKSKLNKTLNYEGKTRKIIFLVARPRRPYLSLVEKGTFSLKNIRKRIKKKISTKF